MSDINHWRNGDDDDGWSEGYYYRMLMAIKAISSSWTNLEIVFKFPSNISSFWGVACEQVCRTVIGPLFWQTERILCGNCGFFNHDGVRLCMDPMTNIYNTELVSLPNPVESLEHFVLALNKYLHKNNNTNWMEWKFSTDRPQKS